MELTVTPDETTNPTERPRLSHESREIEVGKLKIRPSYQRPLVERRVVRMANDWDDELAGTIEVSFSEGHYWVVDGQHRLAAMRAKGVRVCRALVHYGLTIDEEARLFARLNSQRTAIVPRDLYRAELVAGVERSIRVRDTLDKHGLHVAPTSGHEGKSIAAVGHLWELDNAGVLDRALQVIRDAWADAEGTPADGALAGRVNAAIGRFIEDHEHAPEFNLKRYVAAIAKRRPHDLIREASVYNSWRQGSAITLARWYNYGLRQNKLPEPK